MKLLRISPSSSGLFAKVDDADYERLSRYTWHARPMGDTHYAYRTISERGRNRNVQMHREVLGFPIKIVDHANRDGLDNRRENLRLCDLSQNQGNRRVQRHSSRFKGVYWKADKRKWAADIQFRGRRRRLGCFTEEREAALAYDAAARQVFGEFARTNFQEAAR